MSNPAAPDGVPVKIPACAAAKGGTLRESGGQRRGGPLNFLVNRGKTVPDTAGEFTLQQRSVGQLGGGIPLGRACQCLHKPLMKHRKLCAKSLIVLTMAGKQSRDRG